MTRLVDLAGKLAKSPQVQACFVSQWFRFAFARLADEDRDACTLQRLKSAFSRSDHHILDLLTELTTTPTFLGRSTP